MKKHYILLPLAVAAILTTHQSVSAQDLNYEQEVRGVWITNVDSDILFSKSSIAEGMDFLAQRGFNVVFPVVWNKGYTLYPSAIMDSLFGIPQDPFFAEQGRDPLAELIVEAHRNGMEVIPWFEYGFATSFSQQGGHILSTKPEWAAIDKNGDLVVRNGFDWMNPLHPEVQDFMLGLMQEVIEGYDVDGIQGDDRLPAMPVEGGYSEYTKELYRQENGGQDPTSIHIDPRWIQWRSNKLTQFGGQLYRMVKAHDPNLIVSMAPSVWPWSRDNYLQDWPAWLDSNYVDIVHPQVYRWDQTSYQNEIRRLFGSEPGSSAGYVNTNQQSLVSPGLIVKAGSRFNSPESVVAMMEYHRRFQGSGESFFFYEGMGEKNDFLADTLHTLFYNDPAILPGRKQLWRPPPPITLASDPAVRLEGEWLTDENTNGFQGPALYTSPGSTAQATTSIEAPYTATYDVYTFIPQSNDLTTYSLSTGEETDEIVTTRDIATGWIFIGTVSLEAGMILNATTIPDPTSALPTYTDAWMLLLNRSLSPGLNIDIALTSSEESFAPVLPQPVLDENYPDPFTLETAIPFYLPRPSIIRLTIYDVLGREVSYVVDQKQYSAGQHELRFTNRHLPAGVYYYRLQTETFSQTRTMILIR